jgi:phage/plasmid-associated DNA primase
MVVPAYLFVDEVCQTLPKDSPFNTWAPNAELYTAYRSWCDDAGHHSLSRQNFLRQLSSHPAVYTKVTSGERRKNLKVYNTSL